MKYAISCLAYLVIVNALLAQTYSGHPPPQQRPQPARILHSHVVHCTFSPDGKLALVSFASWDGSYCDHERGVENYFVLYDLARGAEISRLGPQPSSSRDDPSLIAFLPDSRHVVWTGPWQAKEMADGRQGSTLEIWDALGAQRVRTLEGLPEGWGLFGCLAVSRDGRLVLALCSDGKMHLWNVETGKHLRTFNDGQATEPPYERITTVAFSPDSKQAISAVADDGTLTFWDVDSGRLIRRQANGGLMSIFERRDAQFAFSPSGKFLVTDRYSKKEGSAHPPSNLQTEEHWLTLLKTANSEHVQDFLLRTADGHVAEPRESSACRIAFAEDGKCLVCSQMDADGNLWLRRFDLANGRDAGWTRLTQYRNLEPVYESHRFQCLSPDGKLLVTASGERIDGVSPGTLLIKVWDVRRQKEISTLHQPARRGGPQG